MKRRWPLALLLSIVVVLGASAGALWSALYTDSGTRWLLQRVPGLTTVAARGSLLGGDFTAQRIEWSSADQGPRVEIDGFAWRGLRWRALPNDSAWLALAFDELAADRVTLHTAPSPEQSPPPAVPASLRLPLDVRIERLRIGNLRTGAAEGVPIEDIEARVHLGAEAGAAHAVDRLKLSRQPVALGDGSLRIGSDAPFPTDAKAELASAAAAPLAWQSSLSVHGPLERLQASATLKARGMSADASALLLPFAAWPLPALDATTRGLDASALLAGAPATSIDARVHIETEGIAQPARISADITNTAPGRIDEGRLPVRRIELAASARPDQPRQFDASTLAIEFADATESAGRFDGRTALDGERLQIEGRIAKLQPQRLDSRAAPVVLNGPVTARIDGLGGANRFDVQTTLDGLLPPSRAMRRAVRLELDVAGTATDIELRRALARAGEASAELSGRLQRPDAKSFHASGRGRLERFDPRPFWPGHDDSPLRRGPHRLNAATTFDLRIVPPDKPGIDAWLAAIDGSATLKLTDSVLAGVAASADVALRGDGGRLQGRVALDAAGNRLRVEGSGNATSAGTSDRWQLELNAPALAALAPLARLVQPATAPPLAFAGALDAKATLAGRWPRITSDGQASLRRFAFGDVALARGDARWNVGGTSLDAPLDVQIELADARVGRDTGNGEAPLRVSAASLRIDGSLASHRIDAQATSPLRPPAWVDQVTALRTGEATLARLRAQGSASANAWRGSIDELRLGAAASGDTAAAPWLATQDVQLVLDLDPATRRPTALAVEPGSAELLGARLAWQRIGWRAGSAQAAQLEVLAQLEPIAIAPILARLQPDFGWQGDLKIGARIDVRSTPDFIADVVVQRSEGDLSIVDPLLAKSAPDRARQPLGLSELRLALAARDGVWHFTQALAGTVLGVAAGAQSMRLPPRAVWPAADTPLEGVLEMQVADLGVWSTWLPAGWRIGGTLRASAAIGGRFGAPEYTGRVSGRKLAVRNVLEGVAVRDGELDMALQGATARIERFVVHAGDGTVTLDGDARFGATPQARLKLVAKQFQVLGRVDRRIVASGEAALQLDADALRLDGRMTVDEGLIDVSQADAPSLGDDVVVLRDGDSPAPPPADDAAARDVRLDLRVGLGEQLRVRGRGIDARLAGELHVTSPRGRLAVNGTVRVVDGEYAAYGQQLAIERGVIAFSGPIENPRLDILAIRPKLDVMVGVAITGNAQSPRVRLASEPEMSDTAKLSWLVLGREPDGLGRTDAALLQRAALGVLAGEEAGATDRLTSALGLDELSVSQTEGETSDTVVTLGKQLGQRWYVGYERGLNATAGSWQLIYRIAQRFTLRGQSGLDNSLDLIWTWRWD